MLYLDTSVLVASLTNEARTHSIQEWLVAQPADQLAISAWVMTEFSAALSIKLRTRQLNARHRADALAAFTVMVEQSLTVLPTGTRDFLAAARYADQHKAGLRAGDALHLAVVANNGAQMITLDKTLARAAEILGVSTRML